MRTQSNRWMQTLSVISATLLIVDAVPLPQSTDSSDLSLGWDTASSSNYQSSTPYDAASVDDTGAYPEDSAAIYAGGDDEDTYPIAGTTWESDAQISDLSSFLISNFSSGSQNIEVLAGSPSSPSELSAESVGADATNSNWDSSINSLRVTYPAGSLNPGNNPRGGSTFYAHPMNLRKVHNATLEYSVFFPKDFDFVKGGKLPGLYGGHSGCAGGVDAKDCFSTRMMWRENGHGELYLYAPRHRQTQRLCRSPPFSDCSTPYGLSIGRGSWTFQRGGWTDIRQDVWLNTPGKNDGGFNIWINGKLVVHADDVFFRDVTETCLASMGNSAALWSGLSPIKRDGELENDDADTFITEDWLSVNQDVGDSNVAIRSAENSSAVGSPLLSMVKRWFEFQKPSRRSPSDDGHWKGINGYPGDPGYNGGNNVKIGTPGDVYTYEFTEVVTFPTALALATTTETETETATVTVTAAPEDPSADDPARKKKRQDIPDAMITGSVADETDSLFSSLVTEDALTAASPEATDVDALQAPAKKPVPPKPKVPPKPAPPKPKPVVKSPVKPVVPPKPVPAPAKPTPPPAPKPVVPAPKPPASKSPVPKTPAPAPPPPPPPPPGPKAPLPPPVKSPAQAPVIAPPPPAPKAPTPPPAPKTPGLLPVPNARIASVNRPYSHLANVDCERGFVGLFFSTFFGGHTETWASPKEQNTYFRNFRIRINQ
ncbi:uncharacterized protein I206_103021 [Kwoniella pini CBS 10737]|uniref:Polysaccharide lyase 14 domain-containing protein n=1 Tax=Kwoniella pini CBS 10737 TaxID=1296096 RepID=A0A1B9IB92_9TREE|nr:uncharacterized protein I206_01974 [Kwoniella pini CBS 10737]OCF52681.1 hypothetical protein I206_01974 [Kwoniella pini CBS 10737]